MSTAALPVAGPIGEHHRVFWRFGWKEYRMLRGFWLAVAALAVMIQLITLATLPASPDRGEMLFSIALGATVLYAVGAAATLFAVEHEEETYELLTTLPVEWLPVFWAKLLVAVGSSLALGAVLVGSSFAFGGVWDRNAAYLLLPSVAESIAWGIFMSLTIRRPLVAAVATIAVVSCQVNLVMSYMTERAVAIWDADNYLPALPWRLGITAVVLLMDVVLGREWLRATAAARESLWKGLRRSKPAVAAVGTVQATQVSARRMMSRLLWQTWRESWRGMLLLLFFAAAAGVFGILVLVALEGPTIPESYGVAIMFAFAVFLSAVFATGVFGNDQRGRSYRFLADHGARPRLVWLCRHIVWAAAVVALIAIAVAIVAIWYAEDFEHWVQGQGRSSLTGQSHAPWNPYDWVYQSTTDTQLFIDAFATMLFGITAGYAAGQLCSMLIRRSLSAGLLSLIVSSLLTTWGWVIWVWNVPGGWAFAFLPIVAGLLLASWLRAKDWIIDRNTLGGWLGFAAVLVLPCVWAAVYVATIRVTEVGAYPSAVGRRPVESVVDYSTDAAAKAAGREFVRAMGEIVSLEQLKKREFPSEDGGQIFSALGPSVWRRMLLEENESALNIAIPASKARAVYFEDASDQGSAKMRLSFLTERLIELGDAFTAYKKLDRAFECYLTTLRVAGHARRDMNSQNVMYFSEFERTALHRLLDWSVCEGHTSEGLLNAINQLNEVIPTTPEQWRLAQVGTGYLPPVPSKREDYRMIRLAIETGLPGVPDLRQINANDLPIFAFLANQLPFERERALRVLQHIEDVKWQTGGNQLQAMYDGAWNEQQREGEDRTEVIANNLRMAITAAGRIEQALRDFEYRDLLPAPWSWLSTTYYLKYLYQHGTDYYHFLLYAADLYTLERAVKLQFALIAFRIDHNAYPAELDELLPKYLTEMPLDPYSGFAFEYEPHGLAGGLSNDFSVPRAQLGPDTPFFWGVGYTFARLVDAGQQVAVSDEAGAADESPADVAPGEEDVEPKSVPRFFFQASDDNWAANPMVFPLPQVLQMDAGPAPPADEAE